MSHLVGLTRAKPTDCQGTNLKIKTPPLGGSVLHHNDIRQSPGFSASLIIIKYHINWKKNAKLHKTGSNNKRFFHWVLLPQKHNIQLQSLQDVIFFLVVCENPDTILLFSCYLHTTILTVSAFYNIIIQFLQSILVFKQISSTFHNPHKIVQLKLFLPAFTIFIKNNNL